MQYISSRTIMGSDKVEKIVRPINCLIVGDDEYGKTYPFTRYFQGITNPKHLFPVTPTFKATVNISNEEEALINFTDTGGLIMKALSGQSTGVRYLDWIERYDEEYDGWVLRGSAHPKLDLILMVFNETDQISLFNIKTKLYPELRKHSKKVPIALIGMQSIRPKYLDIWPNMWQVYNHTSEPHKALEEILDKQAHKVIQDLMDKIVLTITNARKFPKMTRIMSAADDRSACELLSEYDDLKFTSHKVTFTNSQGENLLHVLIKRGFRKAIEIVKEKISRTSVGEGAKSRNDILKKKDINGNIPLIIASVQGRKEIFETVAILCRDKALATFENQNEEGENFVHVIARNDYVDLLDSLIHNILDLKNPEHKLCLVTLLGQVDQEMNTALMITAARMESKCFMKLCSLYLDIAFPHTNKPNAKVENFLHFLTKQPSTDIIDALTEKANSIEDETDKHCLVSLLQQKDSNGSTPLRTMLEEENLNFKRLVHLYLHHAFSETLAQNSKGENFLHISSRLGIHSLIKSLANKSSPFTFQEDVSNLLSLLSQKDENGNNPLLSATFHGQRECFSQLMILYKSSDFSSIASQNLKGENILHICAKLELSGIMDVLMENLPTTTEPNNKRYLIDLISQKDCDENTPMLVAAYSGNATVFAKMLEFYHEIDFSAVIIPNSRAKNVIHICIKYQFTRLIDSVVEMILRLEGVNDKNSAIALLNQTDTYGNTPLISAAFFKRTQIFATLFRLHYRFDFLSTTVQNESKENCLHVCTRLGLESLIDGMIEIASDLKEDPEKNIHLVTLLNQQDNNGNTPLVSTVYHYQTANISKLLALYIAVDETAITKTNKDGDSFIHICIRRNFTTCVDALLENAYNPVQILKDENVIHALDILLEEEDVYGHTPIMSAVKRAERLSKSEVKSRKRLGEKDGEKMYEAYIKLLMLYHHVDYSAILVPKLQYENILHMSSRQGLTQSIDVLEHLHPIIDTDDFEDENTAMILHRKSLEALMKQKDVNGRTPLVIAAEQANFDYFIKMFKSYCTNEACTAMKTQNTQGENWIHVCVRLGRIDMFNQAMEWVLKSGSEKYEDCMVDLLNQKDINDKTPLPLFKENKGAWRGKENRSKTKKQGSKGKVRNKGKHNLQYLMQLASGHDRGDYFLAKLFLATDRDGNNPLMVAALNEDNECLSQFLLFYHGDRHITRLDEMLHQKNKDGSTLLHLLYQASKMMMGPHGALLELEKTAHMEDDEDKEGFLELQECFRENTGSSAHALKSLEMIRYSFDKSNASNEMCLKLLELFILFCFFPLGMYIFDLSTDSLMVTEFKEEWNCESGRSITACQPLRCNETSKTLLDYPKCLSGLSRVCYCIFFIVAPWIFYGYEFIKNEFSYVLSDKVDKFTRWSLIKCSNVCRPQRNKQSMDSSLHLQIEDKNNEVSSNLRQIFNYRLVICHQLVYRILLFFLVSVFFLLWPFIAIIRSFYWRVKYERASGKRRNDLEDDIIKASTAGGRVRILEASIEATYQPVLQWYLLYPSFMKIFLEEEKDFTHMMDRIIPYLSIISSILCLAWAITGHKADFKSGALDILVAPASRLVLFCSDLLFIISRMNFLIFFMYSFGPGRFYPGAIFLAIHLFVIIVFHVLFSDSWENLSRKADETRIKSGPLTNAEKLSLYLSYFHGCLLNGLANTFSNNGEILIDLSKDCKTKGKMFVRYFTFDLIFFIENMILAHCGYNLDIKSEEQKATNMTIVISCICQITSVLLKIIYYKKLHVWSDLHSIGRWSKENGKWVHETEFYFNNEERKIKVSLC